MALSGQFLKDLTLLKREGLLHNRATMIEIGAQQLANAALSDDGALDELYRLHGRSRPDLGQASQRHLIDGLDHVPDENPSSREFWQSLGFEYSSIDFGGHRDSVALDLNRDSVPPGMHRAFDLVVNTGTTEHVANQANAFRVIHDLTRRWGIMMHEVPAGGMMSHGLINYNLKFFWHLCRENDYRVVRLRLTPHEPNPVPSNIIDSNAEFASFVPPFFEMPLVPDFSIIAILMRINDHDFVTPLDVPTQDLRISVKSPLRWRRRLQLKLLSILTA